MEIKKILATEDFDAVYYSQNPYIFAVHYRGFVASGHNLGARIGRCYEAANQTTL